MKKYILKDKNKEVKLGDNISVTVAQETLNGKIYKHYEGILHEHIIPFLCSEGILEEIEVKEPKPTKKIKFTEEPSLETAFAEIRELRKEIARLHQLIKYAGNGKPKN